MNARPRIAWAPDYPWGMPREDYERYLTQIERGWGTRAFAEQEAVWPMERMTREEAVDFFLEWMRLSAAPGDASALFRMFHDSDVREVLGTIRVPALVLSRGGEMEAEARAFASLLPGSPGDDARHRIDGHAGERRWHELIAEHHRVVRGCLARYRGRELDTAGDGFFAAFDRPARGIRCAQAIVEAVQPLGIEVRAGVHTGECRTIDGKAGGLAVSIGARVTSLARPSEVLVSQTGSGISSPTRGSGSPIAASTS
jgi:hypothetical protein